MTIFFKFSQRFNSPRDIWVKNFIYWCRILSVLVKVGL